MKYIALLYPAYSINNKRKNFLNNIRIESDVQFILNVLILHNSIVSINILGCVLLYCKYTRFVV